MKIGRSTLCFLLILVASAPAYAQDEEAPTETTETEVVSEEAPAAQPNQPDTLSPDKGAAPGILLDENDGRGRTNRIGALVLGGWALGNFGWATVGLLREPDERATSFHLTNAAVNLVTAGIAVTTYFANLPKDGWADYDTIRTLNESHNTEKLYLLSTGLDFAYIATGAYLTARGNLDRKEGMVGTGRSLMLQGSFLAAFDIAMFTFHMLRRTTFVSKLLGQAE